MLRVPSQLLSLLTSSLKLASTASVASPGSGEQAARSLLFRRHLRTIPVYWGKNLGTKRKYKGPVWPDRTLPPAIKDQSNTLDKQAHAEPKLPLQLDALSVTDSEAYEPTLHVHGQRIADPGEERYKAPVWIPPQLRQGIPRILYTDPWDTAQDDIRHRQHAKLLHDTLLARGPMTAPQLFDYLNAQYDNKLFGTVNYVVRLLEHMRRTRLLEFKRKPVLQPDGSYDPKAPKAYVAVKYQLYDYGDPVEIAKQKEVDKQERVKLALRRLRNRKSPFIIVRKQARYSLIQHELMKEKLRNMADQGLIPPEMQPTGLIGTPKLAAQAGT